MTREFEIDLAISGTYNESLYELEAVEEALAEWALTYPETMEWEEGDEVYDCIDVQSVHVDSANSFLIVN